MDLTNTATPLTPEARIEHLEQLVSQLAAGRAANEKPRRMWKIDKPTAVLAGIGTAILVTAGVAMASRNSAGTYSTPNTFVAGTTINSASVNSNFSDLGTEMTNSLERNGKGGMLAALRGVDGTLAAPALSFTSETGSGLFRNGASDVRMSVSGALVEQYQTTGVTLPGNVTLSGASSLLTLSGATAPKVGIGVTPVTTLHVLKTGSSGVTADSRSSAVLESSSGHFLALNAPNAQFSGILFGDVSNANRGYIQYNNSTSGSADQMQFAANATVRATVDTSGVLVSSGAVRSAGNVKTCSATGGPPSTCTATFSFSPSGCVCTVSAAGASDSTGCSLSGAVATCRVTASGGSVYIIAF